MTLTAEYLNLENNIFEHWINITSEGLLRLAGSGFYLVHGEISKFSESNCIFFAGDCGSGKTTLSDKFGDTILKEKFLVLFRNNNAYALNFAKDRRFYSYRILQIFYIIPTKYDTEPKIASSLEGLKKKDREKTPVYEYRGPPYYHSTYFWSILTTPLIDLGMENSLRIKLKKKLRREFLKCNLRPKYLLNPTGKIDEAVECVRQYLKLLMSKI